MGTETKEAVKKMIGTKHENTYLLQEKHGIVWEKKMEKGGRYFKWVPLCVREPIGKERITFESTSPITSNPLSKQQIFDNIPALTESDLMESKILCLNELVKPETFRPIIIYKK